jgi:hypothetical protein
MTSATHKLFPTSDIGRIAAAVQSVAILLAMTMLATLSAPAQNLKVIYSFSDAADGGQPYSQLVRDPDGNGYGTAAIGGNLSGCGGVGCGAIFEVTRTGQYKVLYTFAAEPMAPTPGPVCCATLPATSMEPRKQADQPA